MSARLQIAVTLVCICGGVAAASAQRGTATVPPIPPQEIVVPRTDLTATLRVDTERPAPPNILIGLTTTPQFTLSLKNVGTRRLRIPREVPSNLFIHDASGRF